MEFELRFTDKEITVWGGMGLMKRMLDCIGFDSAMEVCDLVLFPKKSSYQPLFQIQVAFCNQQIDVISGLFIESVVRQSDILFIGKCALDAQKHIEKK